METIATPAKLPLVINELKMYLSRQRLLPCPPLAESHDRRTVGQRREVSGEHDMVTVHQYSELEGSVHLDFAAARVPKVIVQLRARHPGLLAEGQRNEEEK